MPGSAYVVGEGLFAENVRGGAKDTDADGLSDHTERLVGTDPVTADSDADGLSDASEASLGTDPTPHRLRRRRHRRRSEGELRQLIRWARAAVRSHPTPTPAWTLQGAAESTSRGRSAGGRPRRPRRSSPGRGRRPRRPTPVNVHGTLLRRPTRPPLALRGSTERAGRGQAPRSSWPRPRTRSAIATCTARPHPTAADPRDASIALSFTQWSARQAGVKLEGTAEYQYMQLKRLNHDIPVEQVLRTKGAPLFDTSASRPVTSLAGQAHVAISLGDGQGIVEAKGTKYGVGERVMK